MTGDYGSMATEVAGVRRSHAAATGAAGNGADTRYLWWSGNVMPYDDAQVHVSMIGWPGVSAVFEGIRAYWNAEQETLYVFRLEDHLRRLSQSMRLLMLRAEFTMDTVAEAVRDLFRRNNLRQDAYTQPFAFGTSGRALGGGASDIQTAEIVVTTRPSASGLLTRPLASAGISSWTRISDNAMPPRAKAFPNYLNSRLASAEANRAGYDHPIFLHGGGKVSEGAGACIFIVRDGVAVTPPVTASILEGITRDCAIRLLGDMGVPVQEREMDRTELYLADEVFFAGTAMEISPIARVDGYPIGDGARGPVVARLEKLFHDEARGITTRHPWRTRV